jgi:hypothetical protein
MANDSFAARLKKINGMRHDMGLPAIKGGNRNCLKCSKKFFSMNVKSIRMCDSCSGIYSENYLNNEVGVNVVND